MECQPISRGQQNCSQLNSTQDNPRYATGDIYNIFNINFHIRIIIGSDLAT